MNGNERTNGNIKVTFIMTGQISPSCYKCFEKQTCQMCRNENDGMKTNVWFGSLHFCSSILLGEWNNMYFSKSPYSNTVYLNKWHIWLAATKHTNKHNTDFLSVCVYRIDLMYKANAREEKRKETIFVFILLCISYDFISIFLLCSSSSMCLDWICTV